MRKLFLALGCGSGSIFLLSLALLANSGALMHALPGALANVVSVSAGVAPNPDNTLAAQLAAKQSALDEEAQQLDAERHTAPAGLSTRDEELLLGLYLLGALICGLLAFNFYLDWKRGRISLAG